MDGLQNTTSGMLVEDHFVRSTLHNYKEISEPTIAPDTDSGTQKLNCCNRLSSATQELALTISKARHDVFEQVAFSLARSNEIC
jgi:hypothetical protein